MQGWEVRDGALAKPYDCADFDGSMAFANRVAEAAAEADHHPDIAVSWDTVTLRWVTHSAGGITETRRRDGPPQRRPGCITGSDPVIHRACAGGRAGAGATAVSVTSTSRMRGPSTALTSKRAPSNATMSPTRGARPSSPNTNPPMVW